MSESAITLTAREPEDLLAMAPVVLGFVPRDSVVMLTFGARRPFHARVDLPDRPDELPELVSVLLEPARHHGVRRVVLLVYTADADWAEAVTGALAPAFAAAGIEVLSRLAADGRRWWALPRARADDPGWPYDVSAHPFLAKAVLHGLVTLGSRAELAETLEPDPQEVASVAELVGDLPPLAVERRQGEARWAAALVRRCTTDGGRPGAAALARLLVGMRDLRVRDAAWLTMSRADAAAHVEFWRDVVRRTPVPLLPAPASVLGFAAWLSGHGALAWCAVDRSREADPAYRLAELLAEALTCAVPPSSWDAMVAANAAGDRPDLGPARVRRPPAEGH